jgi:AraC-like DNA-binding protein
MNIILLDSDKAFINAFIRQIETEEGDFSVKLIAKKMGMSYSLLYKKTKKITGKSTIEFIRSIRLQKAAKMLSITNLQINEIAFYVGFNDVKYFRKLFQQHYNMNPSAFQKQYRKN